MAIIIAILSKNVIISLFAGSFLGVLVLSRFSPITAVKSLIMGTTSLFNLQIVITQVCWYYLIFIGGFIALIEKSGGAQAFAGKVTKLINTKT